MKPGTKSQNSTHVPTLAAVAKAIRISETALYAAKRRFDDFPKPSRRGYLITAFEKFAARHGLWHHRQNGASGDGRASAYSDARTAYLRERTERERVRKEIELVEQQVQVGNLVARDDVVRITGKLVAVIMAELDFFVEAVDRSLPISMTDEQREPVLKTAARCVNNLRTAAQHILSKDDDDDEA